ncbi:MAG TPA: fatty acid desaturase [Caulobacteraceae bacterium]|jgi:omega-6 fatty acid desaturase (delta-12 desaturase)|nr:fatty acid desaturase [Caulobacteraceae bacterium]
MGTETTAGGTGHEDLPAFARRLLRYRRPSAARGLFEIAVTAVPLAAISVAAWLAIGAHIWWGLLLILPAAAFLVRLFMIQHDCGHGAFFPSKPLNDWVGRVIGILTLTPYDYWGHSHAVHHATSGALDRRTLGGIDTLTVDEYLALPPLRRFGYRLYRHPAVMFGLGPAFVFLLQHRAPVGLMRHGWRPWVSVLATNLGIAALAVGLMAIFGVAPVLLVSLPSVVLAASIGVWLFFVQHQFEQTYWARAEGWNFQEAALRGSSHYDLPPVLRWFTANIGIHHVHHLNSRIPYYRLPQVLRDEPHLKGLGRLTLLDSLRCVGLSLWDEAGQRLISFREIRGRTAEPRPAAA